MRREGGFALLAVIWVIALLCVMAMDVIAAGRREAALAADLAVRARLSAAADAGLAIAIHGLLRGEAPDAPRQVAFAGAALTITVEEEAGKLDLNAAPPAALRALFESLRQPRPAAAALVAAIEDWKDDDDTPRPGGAEAREYRLAGGAVPPRDGSFESVEELAHVAGMTPALLAEAAPALTVHSQREAPDRRSAPPILRRSLGPAGPPPPPPLPGSAGRGLAGRAFLLRVEATLPDGPADARFLRSAIVRPTGNPREPYWIQDYR